MFNLIYLILNGPKHNIRSRMSTPTPSERQVAFGESLILFFKNYFKFSGRTGRSGYWCIGLWGLILGFAAGILDVALGFTDPLQLVTPANVINLLILIPAFALGARRLHDVGKSGWWQLLYFTIIGIFVVLYWATRNGERRENDFGPDVEAGRKLSYE